MTPQFGITTCDNNCGRSYQIEYNKSIPPNHESENWVRAGLGGFCSWVFCPVCGKEIIEALKKLKP